MAVQTHLGDVYATLDAAVAALTGDEADTMLKIATYLKNRRATLREIVVSPADPTSLTFATNDGPGGVEDVPIMDNFGDPVYP